jgi:hypothetical protein
MVTDSDASALPAVAASIRRRSGRFSDQNNASASSLSKIGTSSQLANVRICFLIHHLPRRQLHPRISFFDFADEDADENDFLRKSLIHFPLVKKSFFRFKHAGMQNADQPAVRPIHAENSFATGRHPQVEETRLHAKPRRVRQQPHGKRIFKRLFNFPLIQRTIQLKWRIIPIELHNGGLIVNNSPMHCDYNVFTHECKHLSIVFSFWLKKQGFLL